MNESRFSARTHRLSIVVTCLLVAGGLLAVASALGIGGVNVFFRSAWSELKTMPPLVYFTAMTLICILPVPISPFYLAAGPLFGFKTALLWIAPAVAVNQILAHALTDGVMRPSLEALLSQRGYLIPRPKTEREESLLTALIRVTPGVPYAVQNWILGLAGVDRTRYLAISWPIQMLYAIAWVMLGESAFEGRAGTAMVAIGLVIVLALVARWTGQRLRASRESRGLPDGRRNA
jgi:uncharacterized membrane protein YdjX (TVP38/TMEM64 family)